MQKHAQLSLFVIYLYVREKQRVYKVCVIIIFVFIFNISMILFCLVFCLTLFTFWVNSTAEGSIKSRLMLSWISVLQWRGFCLWCTQNFKPLENTDTVKKKKACPCLEEGLQLSSFSLRIHLGELFKISFKAHSGVLRLLSLFKNATIFSFLSCEAKKSR